MSVSINMFYTIRLNDDEKTQVVFDSALCSATQQSTDFEASKLAVTSWIRYDDFTLCGTKAKSNF
jgi:hypothetical protein